MNCLFFSHFLDLVGSILRWGDSTYSRMEHGRVERPIPDWNSLRRCRFLEASSGQQVSTARPFLNPLFSCLFQVRESAFRWLMWLDARFAWMPRKGRAAGGGNSKDFSSVGCFSHLFYAFLPWKHVETCGNHEDRKKIRGFLSTSCCEDLHGGSRRTTARDNHWGPFNASRLTVGLLRFCNVINMI